MLKATSPDQRRIKHEGKYYYKYDTYLSLIEAKHHSNLLELKPYPWSGQKKTCHTIIVDLGNNAGSFRYGLFIRMGTSEFTTQAPNIINNKFNPKSPEILLPKLMSCIAQMPGEKTFNGRKYKKSGGASKRENAENLCRKFRREGKSCRIVKSEPFEYYHIYTRKKEA